MRYGRSSNIVRGMTLVELLVVVAIIMLLAAATIPRLRPEMDRSRIREAARSLQLYLSSARAQAMATGRPCGIQIERLVNYSAAGVANAIEPGCSTVVTQVESPVPYCGDSIPVLNPPSPGSLATVTMPMPPSRTQATVNIIFTGGFTPTLVSQGDLIQLGCQGPMYTITGVTATQATAYIDVSQGLSLPWNAGSSPVPYKIFRQHVKSAAAPLQLPSPAVIDLTLSGPDQAQPGNQPVYWYFGPNDTSPVIIMFAPDGSVSQVYAGQNAPATHPITPICLLVGNRQNVNDPNPQNWNSQSFNSLWVAINPPTGLIVTTDLSATSDNSAAIYQTRTYARQSNAKGGE